MEIQVRKKYSHNLNSSIFSKKVVCITGRGEDTAAFLPPLQKGMDMVGDWSYLGNQRLNHK